MAIAEVVARSRASERTPAPVLIREVAASGLAAAFAGQWRVPVYQLRGWTVFERIKSTPAQQISSTHRDFEPKLGPDIGLLV